VLIDEACFYSRAISQRESAAVTEQPVTQRAQTDQPARVCAAPVTSWHDAAIPGVAANPEPSSIEMGLKARTGVDARITGVRFHETAQRTGSRLGRLWNSTGRRPATRPSLMGHRRADNNSGCSNNRFSLPLPHRPGWKQPTRTRTWDAEC